MPTRLRRLSLTLATAAALTGAAAAQQANPVAQQSAAAPQQGNFYTGKYRNLFTQGGHTPQQVDTKLQTAYAQFFHGDPQTQSVYFASGKNSDGPLAYVTDWANHDVRSEGMSYGMIIAVQLDHKADFGPPADRAFWAGAATASRDFFVATTNPHTGLAPSYANFDGAPHKTNFGQSTTFGFDAWRTSSNWSVDWNWFHADPREQQLSDRIQTFFASQGPDYPSIYTLGGKPLGPNDPIPSAEESSALAAAPAQPAAKPTASNAA